MASITKVVKGIQKTRETLEILDSVGLDTDTLVKVSKLKGNKARVVASVLSILYAHLDNSTPVIQPQRSTVPSP
jgi:hypothetical protein